MTAIQHPVSNEVDPSFLPVESYISKEWVELERDRLWPRVWQMACRAEEIPNPGDFYTYDIFDDSIIVVRREDGSINAHFNACPHRGRRLTSGCGHARLLHCKFHGWRFTLDGQPETIVDREDWGTSLQDQDVALTPVKVAQWAGWVWVNMDPESESLEEYLGEVPGMLDPFEFDRMAYRWRRQVTVPCNWKTALEAFNEAYHVQTTHPQLLNYHDDVSYSKTFGKHGMFGMDPTRIFGLPSPRLNRKGDIRKGLAEFNKVLWETLQATTTPDMVAASERLLDLPEDVSLPDAFMAFDRFHREELAKRGASLPAGLTQEQQIASGIDWHIFPNMVFLHGPTNLLGYRARPNGADPDSCIFEVYMLERLADGASPEKVEVEHGDDWSTVDWGLILQQDFQNMQEVQRGMKVRGFRGCRTNPEKERAVVNFHQALDQYVGKD